MKDARLQLRVSARLKKQAEAAAKRRGATLSALVTQFLTNLVDNDRIARAASARSPADDVEQV